MMEHLHIQQDDDFNNPNYYNNRELSWLSFNERVLEEVIDERNPLLERVKFLAIFSSNLDEFFMVRVAGLKDQVKVGFNKPENKAGLTPIQQLAMISEKNCQLVDLQYEIFNDVIVPQMEKEGIFLYDIERLSDHQLDHLERYFDDAIFPVLTPMAIDSFRPFPTLNNMTLNLVVVLEEEEEDVEESKVAIVQVPSVLPRFIDVPDQPNKQAFILLEKVIAQFIHKLFRGFKVKSVTEFRMTRNADLTIHEDGADDLLEEIEKELKKRKWGAPVRLEITSNAGEDAILTYLIEEFDIHPKDVYKIKGPLDLTFLFHFYKVLAAQKGNLTYETLMPQHAQDVKSDEDLFETVSKRDLFLHHPYESFQTVIDFISAAAEDPNTLAIKQTLYRVSGDSLIIDALKRAAENGKQVTVLVELKARFDEENNVQWAKELDKAGCHVLYGFNLLKTHSKITLIVKRFHGKIERFVHLGTGNYNDVTAKLYTDMGILTSNPQIGVDATNFFNFLSGFTQVPKFHSLLIAPFNLRDHFIHLIDDEIRFHKAYGDGRIIAKMNSLTDKKIIMKLFEASSVGVEIDLIVRGICCLRPGIEGVSETIRVRSIIGRFLEHSRIYYFHHHGEQNYFLSSADLMTRNMENRVEIMFPVFQKNIKERLGTILEIMLSDNVKAREQTSDGSYSYVLRGPNEQKLDSQMKLYDMTYEYNKRLNYLPMRENTPIHKKIITKLRAFFNPK